jgi:quercetin dioxygenase-like cupin family protein
MTMTRPAELKWGPAPAKLPPGAQVAVLAGDPAKPGKLFTIRAKLPDGYSVPPHTHPTDEHLTVIQGTMLLGAGATFDPTKLRELPAGSYARLPTDQPHFNLYKGETIIQLHGIGPYDVIYVTPLMIPATRARRNSTRCAATSERPNMAQHRPARSRLMSAAGGRRMG